MAKPQTTPTAQTAPAMTDEQLAQAQAQAAAAAADPAAEAAAKAEQAAAKKKAAEEKKAADKAAREEKKAADKAAREAKKAEAKAKKDAEAAAKKAAKDAAKQPEQNGIRRPKPGTDCGKLWEIFDSASAAKGAPAAISECKPKADAMGINEATCRTQYARWRKFHGVEGRVSAAVTPESTAAASTAAEANAQAPQ